MVSFWKQRRAQQTVAATEVHRPGGTLPVLAASSSHRNLWVGEFLTDVCARIGGSAHTHTDRPIRKRWVFFVFMQKKNNKCKFTNEKKKHNFDDCFGDYLVRNRVRWETRRWYTTRVCEVRRGRNLTIRTKQKFDFTQARIIVIRVTGGQTESAFLPRFICHIFFNDH